MLNLNDLDFLTEECRRTLDLKRREAERGHDWVVDSHSISSTRLLELLAYARLGLPVWMEIEKGQGSSTERAVAQLVSPAQ